MTRSVASRRLYEVAVDAPIPGSLTYLEPNTPTGAAALPVGAVVLAPLGPRKVTGYVLGEAGQPGDGVTLRPLADVLFVSPFFPAGLVPFYRWIAQYYHYPLGEVIRTALPLAPGVKSGKVARYLGPDILPDDATACAKAVAAAMTFPWWEELRTTKRLGMAAMRSIRRDPDAWRAMQALAREGLVALEGELQISGDRIKTEAFVRAEAPLLELLIDKGDDAHIEPPLSKSERKLLGIFTSLAAAGPPEISRARLKAAYPNYAVPCKRLIERGFFSMQQRAQTRGPFAGMERKEVQAHTLMPEQHAALVQINQAIHAQSFTPFLLFGVTGSGKTEVYVQAIAETLALGKTALFLVPEIALAAHLEAALHARFGAQLAVLHSGMSDGERVDQWHFVLRGEARVVLGARSAVFAPLQNVGLIVVDEEHESAYKQEDGLPYQGRDLAVLRAQQADCPVILGSATPALTSFYHAQTGKYRLLQLPHRVNPQPLPQVDIVDLHAERGKGLFSERLLAAMRTTLEQGQQVMLFLNRRGFSSFMQCQDCGAVLECPHCRVTLTLHRSLGRLLCHYCGHQQNPAVLCPACRSERVQGRGFGTERIEEEIAAYFPDARIARVDSDTARDRRRVLKLLEAMRGRELDILVGTQMIAKGLHFPEVTLVGVLWADAALSLPDFRAAERGFAQLVQVTGRAGRGEAAGRVIIQTMQPDHTALRAAKLQDYPGFAQGELALRRELTYPPFSRLVNIRLSGLDAGRVERAARDVAAFVREKGRVVVLGPAPAPLAVIRDRTRWQILLKSADIASLHQVCAALLAEKSRLCPQDLTLRVDVDPENML